MFLPHRKHACKPQSPVTFLCVNYVWVSQETYLWTSTAYCGDSFTFFGCYDSSSVERYVRTVLTDRMIRQNHVGCILAFAVCDVQFNYATSQHIFWSSYACLANFEPYLMRTCDGALASATLTRNAAMEQCVSNIPREWSLSVVTAKRNLEFALPTNQSRLVPRRNAACTPTGGRRLRSCIRVLRNNAGLKEPSSFMWTDNFLFCLPKYRYVSLKIRIQPRRAFLKFRSGRSCIRINVTGLARV